MPTRIMKTDQIPISTKKVEIVATVEEIAEPINSKGPKTFRQYEVKYPSTNVNVHRVCEPLPFPEKLEETIAWTDAFVDHIAKLTADRAKTTIQKLTVSTEQIKRLGALLATTEVALNKCHDNAKAAAKTAEDKINALKRSLDAEKIISKGFDEKAKDANALLAKESSENKRLTQENKGLQDNLITVNSKYDKALGNLKKASKEIFSEHTKWEKERKLHTEDHNALAKEHKLLLAEQARREESERTLGETQSKLTLAQIEIAAKDHTIADLNNTIAGLQTDIAGVRRDSEGLEEKLADTGKKLDLCEAGLQAANTAIAELTKKADAAKEKIAEFDGQVQAANATITTLTTEVTKLKGEKDTACAQIANLEADVEASKKYEADLIEKLKNKSTEAEQLRSERDTANGQCLATEQSYRNARKEKEDAEVAEEKASKSIKAAQDDAEYWRQRLTDEKKSQADEHAHISYTAETAEKNAKIFEAKNKELLAQLEAANKMIIPAVPGKRINILSVEYGGQAYTTPTHKPVIDKLYLAAEKGTEFVVGNEFFGNDPWNGVKKTASITYQLDGEGVPIHLVAREHTKLKFRLTRN
ncbi:hypothetical protein P154DRAFT_586650 [Amniculicola lignicola CBS 123094]|uniref:Uncharacterized protein n=1 Tax=Amniculicola lignicola CBS 123094 TaxID=1392246 RepID=A0A6A5VXB0_9PLEO|nr:hypothetical protein P154DRAFT_586650 [Amniculicola lignicola CBS 123094]